MREKDTRALDRRRFLRAMGGASTAAAAATAMAPLAPTEAEAYEPGSDEKKARYRESDHVKAYYRTNRY